MFYLISISTATLLIALGNFWFDQVYQFGAFAWHLFYTVLGVAAVFAIDGVAAFVIRRMPERWFAPESPLFLVGRREKNFYRLTKLNTWKRYIPEWGCFTGFHKDKLQKTINSAYIGRFLLESNYGVAGHIAGALLGYLILLLPFLRPLSVALPIAAVNMVLSILPTVILRFNTPALRSLYRRTLERERRAECCVTKDIAH